MDEPQLLAVLIVIVFFFIALFGAGYLIYRTMNRPDAYIGARMHAAEQRRLAAEREAAEQAAADRSAAGDPRDPRFDPVDAAPEGSADGTGASGMGPADGTGASGMGPADGTGASGTGSGPEEPGQGSPSR